MTIKLSDVSLGTYQQLVAASLSIIKKAEIYFTEKDINLNELTKMRLIEDKAAYIDSVNFEILAQLVMIENKIVIFSAIDNLVKGASGQAIQNMNLLFQFPESLSLK